ncbi:serine/arginine repetitive matrix protein 2-like isoform X3 [Mya arenaria]|uniref:serine/arginine repetitive matrix protein 2-like isoform X3 n=1 Tax=Mya arenaria TaxID=6604 RepID=UPI0022E033EE|nr:serine/arginine repetitive matrix protein 2-like isoform X3 [Mya arenaria]
MYLVMKMDRNRMRVRKGRLRLSPNEEAALLKEETEKRRKLRLQQVREQSKENAARIRHRVKEEKHHQLMKLATDIKDQLDEEKAERVRHLEQQYDNSLRNIGIGHKTAREQPDWSEERAMVEQAENLRAEARGRAAIERQKTENTQRQMEANRLILARKEALAAEKERSAQIAAMPPPPLDPLRNMDTFKPKPVKVLDMNTFSTSHYHLQDEHAVDKAEPQEQSNAREAADLEQERIQERALELKRLRQDQLERARLRHNAALEKELLKHDYNNILHDLSDLQRADRERRQKVVQNIPKQVFEPPSVRMEDREEKQRQLESEFEDMYMAGTDQHGNLSFALQACPATPGQEGSLDVTLTDPQGDGSTLLEPTLPEGVPAVLRDMTNVQKPGKKPEKVLRNLMDRIKSQREEWITSKSMADVGDGPFPQHPTRETDSPVMNGDDRFHRLQPDESPMAPHQQQLAPSAEKQPRVHSPVAMETGRAPAPRERITAMPTNDFSDRLRTSNEKQQTNVKIQPDPTKTAASLSDRQQMEYAEICKQQEFIMEQKRQLELKLQQLTYEEQRISLANKKAQAQSQPAQTSVAPPPGQVSSQGPYPHQSQHPMPSAPPQDSMGYQYGQLLYPVSSMQGGMTMSQTSESMPLPQAVVQPTQPVGFEHIATNGYPSMPPSYNQYTSMPQPFQGQGQELQGQFSGQPSQPVVGMHPHLAGSLSSSGMSQKPMNSIPPTHTTGSAPVMTSQGIGINGYQSQGQPPRSAYQPPSAVLTTDQLSMPQHLQQQYPHSAQNGYYQPTNQPVSMTTSSQAPVSMATSVQGQQLPTVSPGHIPPSSLTNAGMSEQMRKVKEYQEYLLTRHEQSKQVLEETKTEIKKRRENLLQRYPNLDLSRLESLGAKYLGDSHTSLTQQQGQQQQSVPVPAPRTTTQSQGQDSSKVASLLASLAAHPYYASTLSQPDGPTSVPQSTTTVTVGAAQMNGYPSTYLNLDAENNLRKNKFEAVRKSLPFDADESMQTPVRMYEAYAQKNLDTTSTTDYTESDTSTLTERGSPALKAAPRPAPRNTEQVRRTAEQQMVQRVAEQVRRDTEQGGTTTEESDMDTSGRDRYMDPSTLRQEELRQQFAEIQRQKEEIMRRHQQGQQSLRSKEEDLRAKLASLAPEELAQQLRDTYRQQQDREALDGGRQQFNLSTIPEVETPASMRPSDIGQPATIGQSSNQTSGQSREADGAVKRSLDYGQAGQGRGKALEQLDMENVQTQMQALNRGKGNTETVADYSGRNIDDVLERAKRFESEVLEKLRKQTNAVLFNNEFDDSLEFNVSRRQTSGEPLSTGSLTDDSLSTGPLDDTNRSRQADNSRSVNGSFQTSRSWADELTQYKMPASNQSELSFKFVASKPLSEDQKRPEAQATMFAAKNRFQVYSAINNSGSDTSLSEGSLLENSDSMNADDMMRHLKTLQDQLKRGEEERMLLTKKLMEKENSSSLPQPEELSQYSVNTGHDISRPFMSEKEGSNRNQGDLSQYSYSDKSTDASMAENKQSDKEKYQFESPVQSGTSSQQRVMPVRRPPIGQNAGVEPVTANSRAPPNTSGTEYSFALSDSREQRSTSTPGEERRKSALDGTQQYELPSQITVGDKTGMSSDHRQSGQFQSNSTGFSSGNSFHTAVPDSTVSQKSYDTTSPTEGFSGNTGRTDNLTKGSLSAEESIDKIKEEFDRLDKASRDVGLPKVKTFAVSKDGDLISEHSDSDKSQARNGDPFHTDLTTYSLSTRDSTDQFNTANTTDRLSSYSLPESSRETRLSHMSDLSQKSMGTTIDTMDSQPKSSSFTTVTSDPSLNMTGMTTLSQYTLNDTKGDSLGHGVVEQDKYVQDRFASLDNLISESKNLIAKHKQFVENKKTTEEDEPRQPQPWENLAQQRKPGEQFQKPEERRFEPPKQPLYVESQPKQPPYVESQPKQPLKMEFKPRGKTSSVPTRVDLGPKPFYKSAKPEDCLRSVSMDTNSLTGTTLSTTRDSQNTTGNQSNSADVNSLDYLVENSSGITEEPLPDLTMMTMGSELSISEAFNRTEDLNESSDSLKSFEKHENSETDSSINVDEDSGLRGSSRSADRLQNIIEARRHNFMVGTDRREAAAKERNLGQNRKKNNDQQVFRAVPVNVVAEPTLSMAVKSGAPEKGKSLQTTSPRGIKAVSDKKKSFEAKENEMKESMSNKSLNRALQPRGADGGTDPAEGRSRETTKSTFSSSKFGSRFRSPSPNTSSESEKAHHGRLFGEIQQFGGHSGLTQRQSPSPPTQRKTPPQVLPKPVRRKPEEAQQQQQQPSTSRPATTGGSGLSKTLSAWKKSRAVSAPVPASRIPEPREAREPMKNSIKVFPEDAPPALTEEERRKRAEDEMYEKNIRAYNPRLFRLQHRLDSTDDQNTSASSTSTASPPERPQGGKKTNAVAFKPCLVRPPILKSEVKPIIPSNNVQPIVRRYQFNFEGTIEGI